MSECLCRECMTGEDGEERARYQALTKAAPLLLAACESMLETTGGSENWNGMTHDSLVLIEQAIAAAKGEPTK